MVKGKETKAQTTDSIDGYYYYNSYWTNQDLIKLPIIKMYRNKEINK